MRRTYSGKQGGLNDDLVITFQLAVTGLRTFHSSEKYVQFRP